MTENKPQGGPGAWSACGSASHSLSQSGPPGTAGGPRPLGKAGPDNGSAALAYAAEGLAVFPCAPGGKAPAISKADGGNGVLDATTDPAQIRYWWHRWPAANIGLAAGAARGGPDVLDVDVKPDGNGFAALNRLKRAGLVTGARMLVRTRSGGLHLYFRGTAQRSTGLKEHFLDFKSSGGYVVAPPSWVAADDRGPAGYYEVLGRREADGVLDWAAVCALLRPPPKFAQPRRKTTGGDRRDRPGDDYSARSEWDEILVPHGWRPVRGEGGGVRYWCRPGKTWGVSATTRDDGGLYVFSTSTPFDTEIPYTKFGAYAVLNHGGSFRAASQALAAAGYGTARKAQR